MTDIRDEKEQLALLEDLQKKEQHEDAYALARDLAQKFPGSFRVRLAYAGILRTRNELGQAREILQELLRTYPESLTLLIQVAEICSLEKNRDMAQEYYQKVLFLDPFNTAAKQALEELEQKPAAADIPVFDLNAAAQKKAEDTAEDEPLLEIEFNGEEPAPPEFQISLPDETEEAVPEPETVTEIGQSEPKAAKKQDIELKPEIAFEYAQPEPDPEPEKFEIPQPRPEPEPHMAEASAADIYEKEGAAPAESENGDVEFYTESAASLYAAQGLFAEAGDIYRELYSRSKDPRFLELAENLEKKQRLRARISRLQRMLAAFSGSGGNRV